MPHFRSLDRAAHRGVIAGLVLTLLALLGLGVSTGPATAAPAPAPSAQEAVQYFPQTAHLVRGPLLDVFGRAGGLDRFGPPLTEQYDEGGHLYQVFERGALQYDPAGGAAGPRALGSEMVAGHAPAPPVPVGANGPNGLFIVETGHTVGPAFAAFWQAQGGWDRLGKPITEQLNEGNRTTQYFEFARLTLDSAAPGGVREQLQDSVRRAGSPFAATGGPATPDALFVSATGHSISGGFREVYAAHGGAASFGAPLTDEVLENGLRVQYFAAGKLSWDGTRPAGRQVQIEALGRAWMSEHPVPVAALQQQAEPPPATPVPPSATPSPTASPTPLPVAPTLAASPSAAPSATPPATASPTAPTATPTVVPQLPGVPAGWQLVGKGTTTYRGSTAARTHNLTLAAHKLDGVVVPAGGIFSFNRSLGDDGLKAGFVEGLVILNGRTVPGVGGGICQVASTFFRAGFNAGFDIIERHPHSYRVSWYEPPVGFDATVFSDEGVDLRWRNNLPAPTLIHTVIDSRAGTLTVLVYSAAQQPFTVSLDGPYTANRIAHGAAVYEDDAKLPLGVVTQVEHAKDGLDATIYRVITDKATGRILRREKFFSRYQPWRDVYKRGTGTHNTNPNGSGITIQKP